VRPASEAEKARLNDTFAALCRIPSPFGHEAEIAAHVTRELESLGLAVTTDERGNLLTRIRGRSDRTILLCAHLDTVEVSGEIEPVEVDGGWENARDTILGADNKAAVAVFLEVARRASVEGSPVGIELLFTLEEENALAGAKAFDVSRLRSQLGYVFDHASPIGEVVVASPTYYRLEARFRGQAAHAGVRPEDGRSAVVAAAKAVAAMRLGRLDEGTSANVGAIHGGARSTNVVPDRCTVLAEARSLSDPAADVLIAEMVDRCYDAANDPVCDVDVDVSVERLFRGYRQKPSAEPVAAAEAALRACGYTPRRIQTGGGSDANAFAAMGLPCTNLANGTERNHEPNERVSQASLQGMLDVTFALLDELSG
jgi:tripeptide aminopeptidase